MPLSAVAGSSDTANIASAAVGRSGQSTPLRIEELAYVARDPRRLTRRNPDVHVVTLALYVDQEILGATLEGATVVDIGAHVAEHSIRPPTYAVDLEVGTVGRRCSPPDVSGGALTRRRASRDDARRCCPRCRPRWLAHLGCPTRGDFKLTHVLKAWRFVLT